MFPFAGNASPLASFPIRPDKPSLTCNTFYHSIFSAPIYKIYLATYHHILIVSNLPKHQTYAMMFVMTAETPAFTPTEIWTPSSEYSNLDQPIQDTLYEMNQLNPDKLIHSLRQKVEKSKGGVSYAVLNGTDPSEYSDSEALVIFNPFATVATPHALVKAEFVRRVAKKSNVCDADGKLKPVVMLASPGLRGSSLNLTREERRDIRSGELGPAARELLRAVSEKNFGRVALLGFSQGGDMALAGARSAYSANLDTHAVAAGDPAGAEGRDMVPLAGDFFKAGAGDLKKAVKATGLTAQKEALGTGAVDFLRFGLSGSKPLNLTLYKGLGKDVFTTRIQQILDEGRVDKLVVGYGGDSAISKPEKIEPALQTIAEEYGQDSVISIRVEDAKHTWGDELALLAKLYMRAAA